jgi:uncharacterized protein YxeA
MKTLARKQGRPYKFKARNSIITISVLIAAGLMIALPIQDHFNYIKIADASEKINAYKNTQSKSNLIMWEEMADTAKSDNKQLELAIREATASAKYVQLTKAEAKEMITSTFPKEYRERFAKITMECENGSLENTRTHINKDGTEDVGMSQINNKYHRERVERMFGMDFDLAMRIPILNYIYAAWLVDHDKNFHQWACDQLV